MYSFSESGRAWLRSTGEEVRCVDGDGSNGLEAIVDDVDVVSICRGKVYDVERKGSPL
jgi:hypothetical protein